MCRELGQLCTTYRNCALPQIKHKKSNDISLRFSKLKIQSEVQKGPQIYVVINFCIAEVKNLNLEQNGL